jgi:hypothetical protein
MKPATKAMMDEIVEHANAGNDIIPMFFQPRRGGIDATVSAAIRCAKARGLIVPAGLDGVGNPMYRAPVKLQTHAAHMTIN